MSTASTRVVPFPVSNEQFLRAVFGDRWGDALVAYFIGNPDTEKNPNARFGGRRAADHLWRMTTGDNTYWSVGLPAPGGARTVADFEAIYAIVLDDVGPKVDRALAESILGPPNYVLETSPGSCHCGWFIEPLTDRAWVFGLLKLLRRVLGGDNLDRMNTLVRLPVGTNGKPELGPNGFRHVLREWQPGPRIKTLDWPVLTQTLGAVIPTDPRISHLVEMPDPGEIEADLVLKAFRDRGMVLDHGRMMPFGWGFEVLCPWAGEHTDPRSAASYVPVKERFKCHHGHCQDRTMADVRVWADSVIREDSGGLESLARLEFDVVAPIAFAVAVVPGGAIDLWDHKTPPAWPGGILPAVLEDTLSELAERDGLDLGALGATMITAASGAADKRASLTPYAGSRWCVPAVLWLMLIAEPGQRKTAVLAYLLGLLRKRNAERMRAYAQAMANWRMLPAAQRKQAAGPTVRALLAEDTTIEKLQEWMAENPRGLLYLRDELASLFEFGRYTTGTGAAERANFLEFYEGGPTTIGRMTRTTSIDNCALSIIGGIQPHRLADFKGLADDGLLPRFGTILMQRKGDPLRKNTTPDTTAIDITIERLLLLGPDAYRTDTAGEDVIRDIEKMSESLAQRPDIGVGYRGFLRKLHGTHARAALVLHLIDGGQDQVVPADTVARAARYAEFLLSHAEIFYAGLEGSAENTAQAIGSYILRHNTTRVTAGQLRRDIAACKPLRTLKEIQDAVFLLVIAGWLAPETNYPSNSAWRVRPNLGDQFAARKISETARAEAVKQAMNHRGLYR